jgi:hypothetical protein
MKCYVIVCIGCNPRRVALYNCSSSCERKPTKNVVAFSTQRWRDIILVLYYSHKDNIIRTQKRQIAAQFEKLMAPAHTMLSVSLSRSSQILWERGWLTFLESSRQKCLPGQKHSMQCYKMTLMSRYPIFKFQGQKETRIWVRRRN